MSSPPDVSEESPVQAAASLEAPFSGPAAQQEVSPAPKLDADELPASIRAFDPSTGKGMAGLDGPATTAPKELDPSKSHRSKRSQPSALFKTLNKHRRNSVIRQFMDVEAAVGDDDEEEDSEGDLDTDARFSNEVREATRSAKELELKHSKAHRVPDQSPYAGQTSGTGHLVSTIGELERRYQEEEYEDQDQDSDVENDDVYEDYPSSYHAVEGVDDPARFLPRMHDAKLWMIHTLKGSSERDIVITIMAKAAHMLRNNLSPPIYSAFAADAIKGRIYVEADTSARVVDFLKGLRNINVSRISMVPFHEISTVYIMGNKTFKQVAPGQMVRFTAGLYAKDLGQVVEFDPLKGTALVCLVPRIDLQSLVSRHPGKPSPPQSKQKSVPPPQLLPREKVEAKLGAVDLGQLRGTFYIGNQLFQDEGYLLKKVRTRTLITGPAVAPTVAEIRQFAKTSLSKANDQGDAPTDEEESWKKLLEDQASNLRDSSTYTSGEEVLLLNKDLANVRGKICKIVGQTCEIMSDALKDKVTVSLMDIVKYFEPGDTVRVIAGTHKGKSGLVTEINFEKGTAQIFWTQSIYSFQCSLDHLCKVQHSSLTTEGISSVAGFAAGDLVQLTENSVGVISRIDPGKTFSILDSDNQLRSVPLSRIAAKCDRTASATALDSAGNRLDSKSFVVFCDTPYKNATGQVAHIWKNLVFVKLTYKESAPGGYRVCSPQDLLLKHSGFGKPSMAARSAPDASEEQSQRHPNHSVPHPNRSFTQNRSASHHTNQPDSLNGARVKLIGGRDKGKIGKVLGILPKDMLSVLLETVSKIVKVPKSHVSVLPSGASHSKSFDAPSNIKHRPPRPSPHPSISVPSAGWDNLFDNV